MYADSEGLLRRGSKMEEEAPKKKEEKENENEEEEEKEANEECNMKKEIKENENEEEKVEDEECNENEEEEENEGCNMKEKEENENENEEEEEVDDEDEECKRDWAEMAPEVLSQALARVSVRDMFSGVALVCRAWRNASLDPVCWQRVDLRDWASDFATGPLHVERMVRLLIDRSAGRLTHFFISYYATDSILHYIADRCPLLRCLHLANSIHLTDSVFCELAHKFPFLEELDISGCTDLSTLTLCEVGQCCKGLLCLKRNGTSSMHTDEEALAIAKTMPWLKHLEMSDTQILNKGLLALLEGCKDLEYIDVRNCRNLTIGKEMVEKCFKGKEFHISDEWDEYSDDQLFPEEVNWLYDTEIMFHDTFDHQCSCFNEINWWQSG